MRILVTGGAGFIGSAMIRYLISETEDVVLNIDKLTYASNKESLYCIEKNDRYSFLKIDVCDYQALKNAVFEFKPEAIMHFAAESHVDRSIDSPANFVETNIVGTFNLLEISREYYNGLKDEDKRRFKFHHVSTDEVFGDLESKDNQFTELTAYAPNSPYSASKASSDHLVRAWHRTYKLPTIITNCSNNYGPYHFPEKLIPLMIINALLGRQLPVYGNGQQIRDWLYVEDHVRALYLALNRGKIGETYNIGGCNEKTNLEVVELVCDLLEKSDVNKPDGLIKFRDLITFVKDRPGHDLRYAIDASKIINELGWQPKESFESGLIKTVRWYLSNKDWWSEIIAKSYDMGRLGDISK